MAKKLLNEARVSRFMELAGNSRHTKRFINESYAAEMEDPSMDEGGEGYELEEEVNLFEEEEEVAAADDMPEPPESAAPEGDMDMEEEDEDVDVTVDEEQVASLRTAVEVLQSIIDASEEGPEDADPEMDMADEPPMPADAGEPEMDAAPDAGMPPEGEEEGAPEDEELQESLERITQKVLKRVTSRLVKEAIKS